MKKSVKTTLLGSAAVLIAACGNSSTSKSTKKITAPKTERFSPRSQQSISLNHQQFQVVRALKLHQ